MDEPPSYAELVSGVTVGEDFGYEGREEEEGGDAAIPPPGTNTSVYPKIAIQVE